MSAMHKIVPILAPLMLVACGGGPKMNGPDAPRGGSRAEVLYQAGLKLSEKGYCDKAMPVFVCLAGQGHGWEVAAQRAGQCGPAAAKLWAPPMADDQPMRKDASGNPLPPEPQDRKREKFDPAKIRFHYAWQQSPDATRDEGRRQLFRAAQANWPSSQALLVQELVADGDPQSLQQAAIWLNRYDNNPRRKVYGGDDVPVSVRKQLLDVKLPKQTKPWRPSVFAAEPGVNPTCTRLLGARPDRPNKAKAKDGDDDGLIRLPESQSPLPGETGN